MANRENDGPETVLKDWKKIPATIGFRLDEEHRMILAERARILKVSVHDLARHYVLHMLHENDERQRLISAIVALKDELREARTDIAVSTRELLVSRGEATLEEADEWARTNLFLKDADSR